MITNGPWMEGFYLTLDFRLLTLSAHSKNKTKQRENAQMHVSAYSDEPGDLRPGGGGGHGGGVVEVEGREGSLSVTHTGRISF